MKLAIGLLAVSLSTPVHAASFGSVAKSALTSRWTALAVVELTFALDGVTTARCINAGTCREANPLFGSPQPGKAVAFNGVVIGKMAGAAVAHVYFHYRLENHRAITITEYAISAGQGVIDAHNYSLK